MQQSSARAGDFHIHAAVRVQAGNPFLGRFAIRVGAAECQRGTGTPQLAPAWAGLLALS